MLPRWTDGSMLSLILLPLDRPYRREYARRYHHRVQLYNTKKALTRLNAP